MEPKTKPTICLECEHHYCYSQCKANPIKQNFVTGEWSYAECNTINTDGKCRQFIKGDWDLSYYRD